MDIAASIEWLEKIYGSFGPQDGVPESQLAVAARRVGVALPLALREYFMSAGRSRVLNGHVHKLLEPKRFHIDGDHLIFCREKRGGAQWGIQRGELVADDPPVELGYRRGPGQPWKYTSQFPKFSVAIRAMGAWEAVQGGLPFVGVVKMVSSRTPFREPPVESLGVALPAMRAWLLSDGVVVTVSDGEVYLANRTNAGFRQASNQIGIDEAGWDYATILDDN